ncbi:MAG: hypothetical protein APF81_27450 [Desulfosporosinus sp. BRH_c37]|nr:MAG: hypothetical protein APF81_27450 [Desulfosporosinus sp. BRH_c37]
MIKRFFRGTKSIICLECGKVVQDATNDLMIHMPYCGNCSKRIEDAAQNYCGHCGEKLDWP